MGRRDDSGIAHVFGRQGLGLLCGPPNETHAESAKD
jgi:hypothetical protein